MFTVEQAVRERCTSIPYRRRTDAAYDRRAVSKLRGRHRSETVRGCGLLRSHPLVLRPQGVPRAASHAGSDVQAGAGMRTGATVDRPRRRLREGHQRAHHGDAQPHTEEGGGPSSAEGATVAADRRHRRSVRSVPLQQTHFGQDRTGAEDTRNQGGYRSAFTLHATLCCESISTQDAILEWYYSHIVANIRVAQSEFRKSLRYTSRKSSIGARETPRVSKVQWVGGGGGSSQTE